LNRNETFWKKVAQIHFLKKSGAKIDCEFVKGFLAKIDCEFVKGFLAKF